MSRGGAQSEQRAFGRRESRIHAFVRVPGRRAEPCVVRNYSEGGALLAFPGPFEPPARFRLTVEAKGVDVLCEVRRRKGNEFGVEFMRDENGAAPDNLAEQIMPPAAPTPETLPNVLGGGGLVLVMTADELRRQVVL